jgi:hypothetical protein
MTKRKKKVADPGEMTEAERAMYDAQDREQWEASARTIIECDNVLELLLGSWRKIVAGEEKNAKLLYLAATSRLFDKCMNAAIKGPSSGGKSEIRRQVLEFLPPRRWCRSPSCPRRRCFIMTATSLTRYSPWARRQAPRSNPYKTISCAS